MPGVRSGFFGTPLDRQGLTAAATVQAQEVCSHSGSVKPHTLAGGLLYLAPAALEHIHTVCGSAQPVATALCLGHLAISCSGRSELLLMLTKHFHCLFT